jgi:ABC-type enterochelin transport system permease subunit
MFYMLIQILSTAIFNSLSSFVSELEKYEKFKILQNTKHFTSLLCKSSKQCQQNSRCGD